MKRLFIFICVLFMFDAARAATLNIRHNGITKQIELDTTKRTAPSLAMRVGNKTMYATMARTTTQKSGELYVKYNNQTYHILETFPESKFQITTTPSTTSFNFKMSAKGTFYVDWGDGIMDEIIRTNTTETTYSHEYTTAGERTIKMSGRATGYSTDNTLNDTTAAVSFYRNTNVAKIDGTLGMMFPTIEHCTTDLTGLCNINLPKQIEQPRFFDTFCDCANLAGNIPQDLFAGVYGAPIQSMFRGTFRRCSKLTGEIPETLFAGISGAPAFTMFAWTFEGCRGLTGNIPPKLFSGINGAPAEEMYPGVFYGCSGLTGLIPDGLFGNLYGQPAKNMFAYTFDSASQLTGPTARTAEGTRLYDVEYEGVKWENNSVNAFNNMYRYTNIHD